MEQLLLPVWFFQPQINDQAACWYGPQQNNIYKYIYIYITIYYIYKYLEHTFDLCFDRTRHEKAMFWIQNRGQLGSSYIIVVSPFWNLKKIPNTPKKAMVWEHIVFDLCHILVVHVRPWTTWTTGGLIFFLVPLILCIWILKSTELSNKHAHTHTHTHTGHPTGHATSVFAYMIGPHTSPWFSKNQANGMEQCSVMLFWTNVGTTYDVWVTTGCLQYGQSSWGNSVILRPSSQCLSHQTVCMFELLPEQGQCHWPGSRDELKAMLLNAYLLR